MVRATTSPRAMRSRVVASTWSAVVAAPGLPDRVRVALADRVHAGLVRAGRPESAARVSRGVLRRVGSRRLRADLLVRQAAAEIQLGTPPGLTDAAAAELEFADKAFAKGNVRSAVASLTAVQRLLFDRRLHYDRLTSPMADDPGRFLAPWHASATVGALSASRGRREPAAAPPPDRPVRLLIATYGNHSFIEPVRRYFEEMPGVDVRFYDPTGEAAHISLMNNARPMAEHILAGRSAYGDRVAEWLQPLVDWADVVFVDWCAALAVLFGMIDPGSTRMVMRLHSFEAFAVWPHLVDFSRVDDVIFVSEHLHDLAAAAVPGLASGGSRIHVISNAMDLRRFRREKSPAARFTLGVVGIKSIAKDPRWAVEVLRHLRAHDDRYRLVLLGQEINPAASPDSKAYWDRFLADIADLEPAGAVARLGQIEDVPSALTEVGVVLSSSVRESFHCGLVEGAASGAVPVVRDWPFFAGRPHGARSLFPPDWVVDGTRAAADRILAATASEEAWRKTGAAAADHAIATWDWETVSRQFDWVVCKDAAGDSAATERTDGVDGE